MARRKKTTRRRTRRRNPRRYGPSTRRGARRITARRAYAPKRRRRRNPRPVLGSPAVRYAGFAIAGAATAAYLNSWAQTSMNAQIADGQAPSGLAPLLRPEMGEGRMHAGIVGAALTIGLSMLPKVKAKTRSNLMAMGVGMLTQPVTGFVTTAFAGEAAALTGAANGNQTTQATQAQKLQARAASRLRAPRGSSYLSSSHYNNAAAQFLGVPVS